MTFAQQLAQHLREFYTGPNQPGNNLKDALEGIDLAMAQRKIGDHNSILALLFHIDYYINGLKEVLEGGELTIRDKYSYNFPVLANKVAWLDMKAAVFANGEAFSELIAQMDDEALNAAFVKPQYDNYYRNLAGMIEHAYYHLGQIALLKKMLQSEKTLYPKISTYCQSLEAEFDQISASRKEKLAQLAAYIETRQTAGTPAKLMVICTHNSRRSHLGQIWLSVAADYYGLSGIQSFSGGTEATAFNSRAVAALKAIGFRIETPDAAADNPIYQVSWAANQLPAVTFSKAYQMPPNPTKDFGAIMVCNEADAACPMVAGADFRLSLPYNDPKAFDHTELESQKYLERARQIGREMLLVMQLVSQK